MVAIEPAPGRTDLNRDDPYDAFYAEVPSRRLSDWLPDSPTTVLDLSGGCGTFARLMVEAGHRVVPAVHRHGSLTQLDPAARERLHEVAADTRDLRWLAADSLDVVLAESRS